jgi:5-methylcytosine-specific restriction protein A
LLGKNQFAQLFKVGDVIESGAGPSRKRAAHLKILAIEDDSVLYQSNDRPRKYKTGYSVLQALLEHFDSIKPRSITRSVNRILKQAKVKRDHVTETYAFSFAKAIHERRNTLTQGVNKKYFEGGRVLRLVEGIERDPRARMTCLKHWGSSCQACFFDFEKKYGSIGRGIIHVHHHLERLASSTGKHKVDPIKDLIPLCPNCHAVVHSSKEMLTIAQLRKHLARAAEHS